MAERPRFSLDGNFHLSNLAGSLHGKQTLFEQKRVQPIGIVVRNDFNHVVAMAFVERKSRGVIDSCFQANGVAFCSTQTFLGGIEQSRPDVMAAGLSANVNCDYVSHSAATAFCDDEGKDRRPGRVGYFVGRPSNQRKSPWASQVKLQLTAAVSDVGLKTGLINRPKGIKIVAAVIADCE